MKSCPMCGRQDHDTVLVCPCGYRFQTGVNPSGESATPASKPETAAPELPGSGMTIGGAVVALGGLGLMVVSLFMPTSVESSGLYSSGEVANMLLMQSQQNTLTWGAALLVTGTLLYVGGAVLKNVLSALKLRSSG